MAAQPQLPPWSRLEMPANPLERSSRRFLCLPQLLLYKTKCEHTFLGVSRAAIGNFGSAKSQAPGLYLFLLPPWWSPWERLEGERWGAGVPWVPGCLWVPACFPVNAAIGPAPQREDSVYMGQEAGGPLSGSRSIEKIAGQTKDRSRSPQRNC